MPIKWNTLKLRLSRGLPWFLVRALVPLALIITLALAYRLERSSHDASTSSLLPSPPSGYSAELIDSHGVKTSLSNFRGQWLVVAFGFVSCPDICPVHLAYLAKELRGMGATPQLQGKPVKGVFLSVDPKRDSPANLEAFRQHFDKGQNILVAMTGREDELQVVTKSYGAFFQYKGDLASDHYEVAHSSGFYVIAPSGQLATVLSMPAAQGDLVSKLNKVQQRAM